MLGTDVLEKSASLVACSFINNMEDWFACNVEDVDNDRMVEFYVITEVELEASGRLTIALAVYTVFGQVFQGFPVSIMPCAL